MTSKSKSIFHPIIFLLFFSISLFSFYYLNQNRFFLYTNSIKNSIRLLVNTISNEISYGYFQWNVMLEAIDNNDIKTYNELFDEINSLHPEYIEKINIIESNKVDYFDDKYYYIHENDSLKIIFKIFDDYGEKYLKDKFVEISLNFKKLLNDLDTKNSIKLSKNGYDFIYGFKIIPIKSFLTLGHYISSLSIGLLFVLLYILIAFHSIKLHYETIGLYKLIDLYEKRDKYTANHSKNVAIISYFLGKKINLKRNELNTLKHAALLHDIGKIGIPEYILNKNGKLTNEEFEIIKKHPKIGAELINGFDELKYLSKYILYHHEKLDGSGYPYGLEEKDIPIISQIITIADIFEALISNRPYRYGLSPEKALKIMEEMPINKNILNILKSNYNEVLKLLHNIKTLEE
ncbi:hypothetical protein JCM30566_06160 [Marinitoga arctica]